MKDSETFQPSSAISKTLLAAFNDRKERNPRYSLRAFAGQLQISPAQLSQLMSGKRHLTAKMAGLISSRLQLSPRERRRLIEDSFQLSKPETQAWSVRLAEDRFQLIADWRHLAILALTYVNENRCDAGWIALKLKIPKVEAKDCLDRLIRLKMIAVKQEKMSQVGNPFSVQSPTGSEAIQRFHKQLLVLAEEKLTTTPVGERDFSAVVFAADPKKLNKIRRLIEEMQSEAMEKMKPAKSIFVLSCQLFPLKPEGD